MDHEYVRERQIRETYLPVAHSTLWRWVAEGRFPSPIKLGPRVTAWKRSDVEAWAAAQASATTQ